MFLGCSPHVLRALKPNVEGLNFEEWLCAADPGQGARLMAYPKMDHLRQKYPKEVKAWLAGVDPTDWRANLPPPTPPKPYVLRANPTLGRGPGALPEELVDRVRALPARNLVGEILYTWDWPWACLDISAYTYAQPMGAYGNDEDEAAENLKLILIDRLECSGIYHTRARVPFDAYALGYSLLPCWERRT